jgi:acetyl-CoA acyltransferase
VTAGNARASTTVLRAAAGRRGERAKYGLTPKARVVGMATAGVAPRIMGFGPAPAVRKVLALTGLKLDQIDVIELNEAFAAQGLAVLRDLGCRTTIRASIRTAARSRSAIRWAQAAPGSHHRGESASQTKGRYALCTMCIGVGQGIAVVLERA